MATPTLLPEWVNQEAIIVAWPDEMTDWIDWLTDVQATYVKFMHALNLGQIPVVLLIRPNQITQCQSQLTWDDAMVMLVPADYNDTWTRDYAFLTCIQHGKLVPVDYQFNGWGNKFSATKDTEVNRLVLGPLCQQPLQSHNLVVEGGALEIDQTGKLLSTASCLFNPQRNGDMTQQQYAQAFQQQLGANKLIVFKHGQLIGDDTDGHIDTLVRFTPDRSLVVQSSFNRPTDIHFSGLSKLIEECQQSLPDYPVFELPLPEIYNNDGERLPASYANYLLANQQLFMPIYQQPEDDIARRVLSQAYPNYQVIPVDCAALIQQFGSLHCITMQVPEGTLRPSVLQQLRSGVTVYANP